MTRGKRRKRRRRAVEFEAKRDGKEADKKRRERADEEWRRRVEQDLKLEDQMWLRGRQRHVHIWRGAAAWCSRFRVIVAPAGRISVNEKHFYVPTDAVYATIEPFYVLVVVLIWRYVLLLYFGYR